MKLVVASWNPGTTRTLRLPVDLTPVELTDLTLNEYARPFFKPVITQLVRVEVHITEPSLAMTSYDAAPATADHDTVTRLFPALYEVRAGAAGSNTVVVLARIVVVGRMVVVVVVVVAGLVVVVVVVEVVPVVPASS